MDDVEYLTDDFIIKNRAVLQRQQLLFRYNPETNYHYVLTILIYSILTFWILHHEDGSRHEASNLLQLQSQLSIFVKSPNGKSVPFDQMPWHQHMLGKYCVCSVPQRPFLTQTTHLFGTFESQFPGWAKVPEAAWCCEPACVLGFSRPVWKAGNWDLHWVGPFQ